MDLRDLIHGLDVTVMHTGDVAWESVRVCDLTEDSRTALPGSLFIARRGGSHDGNAYVEAAARAGAVAVLTDDAAAAAHEGVPVLYARDVVGAAARIAETFYGGAASRLRLVGVTGTNGKSTVTSLVWQIMNACGVRFGLIGTVDIDDGASVGRAAMTTPPAVELSRTLAMMLDHGCAGAAIEVSSHALDQRRTDAVRIEVGVFTNLTGDHLDYHKSMEAYGQAKAKLFASLARDGLAIVSVDDPAWEMMARASSAPVLRCTVEGSRGAECTATISEESIEGLRVDLAGPWGQIENTSVPLIGRYNLMNVLQAVAVCNRLGLSAEKIAHALGGLKAPRGRMERVSEAADGMSVFVDFAHSDDSLRNALGALRGVMERGAGPGGAIRGAAGADATINSAGGRLWVIFGCGGLRDTSKRPRMGRTAAELADVVVVTSDNPRTERPSEIIDQVLAGIPGHLRPKVNVQPDRARAIASAISEARVGDVIIIAGKGHETEQILPDGKGGTTTIHFDDAEHARTALANRRGKPKTAQAKSEKSA
jgi:UDP-N-acetylmuramoyl-L-alanyl-D-glutamate--2,6-diaminopimelate ligase